MLGSIIAALLLFFSTHLGHRIKNLPFFTKVYATEQLVVKNLETILSLSKDEQNRILLKKYIEAMIDVTVKFDYIPRNELENFIPITLSLSGQVEVMQFEYNNKNLIIHGIVSTQEELELVIQALYKNVKYQLIESHTYKNKKDEIVFSLECFISNCYHTLFLAA
ncbi:MAG: hypothetical protein RSB96_02665 [Oscillospiraceae bacterium]